MKGMAVKGILYALMAITGAAAGWGGSYAVNWAMQQAAAPAEEAAAQPQPSIDAVQLRVRGGQMEWFDGVRWNAAGDVETLEQNDPTEAKSDTWNALAENRAAAEAQQRQEAMAQFDREAAATLNVGEKPVARQPSRQSSTTTQTPTPTPTPAPTPTPTPTPEPTPPAPEWSGDYE